MELTHARVGEGMPIYLQLLEGRDRETLLAVLYLVSCFKEKQTMIVPAVKTLFERVPDDLVRSAVLLCLGTLLDESDPFWQRYAATVEASKEHPLLSFVAASVLSQYQRAGLSQAGVEALVEAAVRPQFLNEQFELLPWYDWVEGNIHVRACESLARIGNPIGLHGLMMVLEQVQTRSRPKDTVRIVETLLDVAFFGEKVYGRYWGFTEKKPAEEPSLRERVAQFRNNDWPDERRSYYFYSQLRYSDEFEINVGSYDHSVAAELGQRFEQEGARWLSEEQRAVLEAVWRYEPLWQVKNDLLKIYGLPERREHLAQLLRRE